MQKGQDFLGRNGRPPKEILRRGRRLNHPQTGESFPPLSLKGAILQGAGYRARREFFILFLPEIARSGGRKGKN